VLNDEAATSQADEPFFQRFIGAGSHSPLLPLFQPRTRGTFVAGVSPKSKARARRSAAAKTVATLDCITT